MKKFVLYTAIFGNPGRFVFPKISDMSVDRFCYTDFDIAEGCNQEIPTRKKRSVQNDFYDVRKAHIDDMMAIEKNRFVKICIPDEIFDNYEYSVYVDCKRPKRIDFEVFLSQMKPTSFFMTGTHRARDCAYYEGEYVASKERTTSKLKEQIEQQLAFYKSEGYPEHNGLFDCSVILRKHVQKTRQFCNLWWEQLCKYSYRDQVSLPYVAWKHGVKISTYTKVGRKKK